MKTTNLELKTKHSLNLSLKLWLPLLQLPLDELNEHLDVISRENPFLEIKHPYEKSSSHNNGFLEDLVLSSESFHERVLEQLTPPLFPTGLSQKVAYEILCDINENGYFDGDMQHIASLCHVSLEFVESIRRRFSKLEPKGIGATNQKEAFVFQLDALGDIDDELYDLTLKIIENMEKIDKFSKHQRFHESISIIKKFSNIPAIEYKNVSKQIIPDFFIDVEDDIVVRINSDYYPDIAIQGSFASKHENIKEKLKEARNVVNLLELRKSTLYKIVLLIVEKQISFFIGGELRPLSMSVLADELSFAESTISRAVSNKYIESKHGIYPLKSFFSNAVASKELSSSQIKNFLSEQIRYEDKENPLKDDDILNLVEQRFGISMVRRTITKYRKLLGILSSKERKKVYKVNQ
ncbi:MAG: RNA polymerase factor sigma-54 [Campylobacteraceae bacterium]|jgi:RNA polymerase sigma-54 factor|nr:RNA polymerase factor sigma-54 [Campylobacteraceae bacterium]